MFESIVYVSGPSTVWAKKVTDADVIARFSSRWRWVARARARSAHMPLDPRRCGYAVLLDGNPVELVEALE